MNFADIASQKLGEIERPALPPQGTYRWVVEKHPSTDQSGDQKWEIVNFLLRCLEAVDVPEEALQDFEGEITNVRLSHRIMLNTEDKAEFDKSLYRLKTFLERHLQIDGADELSLKEALAASVNHQCLATVKWNPDKNDPELFHANIGRTAPVE